MVLPIYVVTKTQLVAVSFAGLKHDVRVLYPDEHIELELFFYKKMSPLLVSERPQRHQIQFLIEKNGVCFSKNRFHIKQRYLANAINYCTAII